ncbi:hypothetical protein AMATHDRAFT_9151 [Amanita thiersii Skay4041]|uniref:Uncharacterized protein n=1 Tax=Amanita thiersii Skay4041 TaxID=703135 RepID=A0A2A9N8P5_9AGAR|nr:hypothetical protein AMATHDRAFT_9151 [Amanita thiersii Skay4041]
MHCFPFKKVKKTQPNSGTGFLYVAPGYKLSMEEIHKVQSKNFNINSYAEELRRKELFALKKLPPKSVDKSKISRPHPLRPPQSEVVLHYDNHIRLYRKYINSLQLDNHVHLYRQHIVQLRKREEKRRVTELAQWRYNERISQREQDEAWDILQRLKRKQRYEDLHAKRRQDEEIWVTIQHLKHKERYEDLRIKRRQDYARSHAYQIETLTRNLKYHPDLRRSLLKDPKNQFLTWLRGGVQLLEKYGCGMSSLSRHATPHDVSLVRRHSKDPHHLQNLGRICENKLPSLTYSTPLLRLGRRRQTSAESLWLDIICRRKEPFHACFEWQH